jgi:hypothetical protein
MRRLFAYLALAALLLTATLVGCRQEPLPASGDAIRFSVAPAAEVVLQTKAKPDGSSYLIHEDSEVLLYGSFYEDGAATKTPLFNGDGGSTTLKYKALSDATGFAWSYDDLKYWDKRYKYDFRAVFPKEKVSVTSGSSSQVDVSYAMASGYDLMVASATDLDAATRMTNSEYTVSLPFQHACAAVRILFTDGDKDYFLKSFQLKNIATAGTLNYGAAEPWTLSPTDTKVYQWKLTSWEIPAPDAEGLGAAPEGWYYVIPQTLSDADADAAVVSFTYSVGQNGTQNIPVTLKLNTSGSASSITKWDAGKAYTYKINIQANEIIFTVSFGDWGANVNTEYEPIG